MAPGDRLREDLESAMPAPGYDRRVAMLVGGARAPRIHRNELIGDVIVKAQPGAEGRDGARLPLAEEVSGAGVTRVGSAHGVHGTFSTWRWRSVARAARDQRAHP